MFTPPVGEEKWRERDRYQEENERQNGDPVRLNQGVVHGRVLAVRAPSNHDGGVLHFSLEKWPLREAILRPEKCGVRNRLYKRNQADGNKKPIKSYRKVIKIS
jgi:hypothetical protein